MGPTYGIVWSIRKVQVVDVPGVTQPEQSIRGTVLLFPVVRHILPEQQTRHKAPILLSESHMSQHKSHNQSTVIAYNIHLEIFFILDNGVIGILNTIITKRLVYTTSFLCSKKSSFCTTFDYHARSYMYLTANVYSTPTSFKHLCFWNFWLILESFHFIVPLIVSK